MADKLTDTNEKKDMTRRTFLKNSGLVAGGVVGGSLFGGLLTNQFQKKPGTQNTNTHISGGLQEARVFINRAEDFDILSAATERIFPKDDLGPGAIELGVPFFIDKQLASEWGTNSKEYMKGPFATNIPSIGNHNNTKDQNKGGPNAETQVPIPTPRYQSILTRSEIFTLGLRKIDQVSQKDFGARFVDLDPDKQDEVLRMFDEDKVEMKGIGSANFFHLLQQTTIEGVYADPVYGGNKDMMGWRMKEYPGPRMSYLDTIENEEFIKMEPESLRDYQGH